MDKRGVAVAPIRFPHFGRCPGHFNPPIKIACAEISSQNFICILFLRHKLHSDTGDGEIVWKYKSLSFHRLFVKKDADSPLEYADVCLFLNHADSVLMQLRAEFVWRKTKSTGFWVRTTILQDVLRVLETLVFLATYSTEFKEETEYSDSKVHGTLINRAFTRR